MMRTKDLRVLRSLLGPAFRGFVLGRGKRSDSAEVGSRHLAHFDWTYPNGGEGLEKLYRAAKTSQWNGETDLDWSIDVDPVDPRTPLMSDEALPLRAVPQYLRLDPKTQAVQRHHLVAWLLSQFLHGEQGALLAACQVTEAIGGTDAKLYGSTQVVDEGRHVEVFHRYLSAKLEKLYQINDNLYVIIDALIGDGRWDIKFLGMQIMIEGLALGAFGTMRASTEEPLLKELLRRVITDEARHVHFGVVALGRYYREGIEERERREREDWAFEMAVLMRNRFLAHEFYDEHYAPVMKRSEWDRMILSSDFMKTFRHTMFRRVIPNLKKIGLLGPNVRRHYEALGLLEYEHLPASDEEHAT